MRKHWQSAKYKAQNRRRVERSLKKIRERKRLGNVPSSEERAVVGEGVYKFVKAPKVFSLVRNGAETAAFFAMLEKRLSFEQPVFIDLSKVREITPDAILYTLSLLDVYEQQGSVRVRGNRPARSQPKELLEVSGFFNFVSTREPVLHRNTKILSIRTGESVLGEVAEEVIRFACQHLVRERDMVSKSNYRSILEAMGNTVQHAYETDLSYRPRWWLLAVYDEVRCCVSFTILDYGTGIPSTVRKNIWEETRKFFDAVTVHGSFNLDHQLVLSALKGEVRTRTGHKYRGKGLPSIYNHQKRSVIGNLVLVSDKAYINFAQDDHFDLKTPLRGTLVTWDFFRDAEEVDQ